MKVLLLPGADGTGVLFKPFLSLLSQSNFNSIEVEVINLNRNKEGEYLNQKLSAQAEYIENIHFESTLANADTLYSNPSKKLKPENKFINEPVILIAESYSGLLAYELLKRRKLNIVYVVFVASFINCPSKLASLAPLFNPTGLKTTLKLVPNGIWGKALFGQWQTSELRSLFVEAMAQTPNELLRQRLKIISKASEPSTVIKVPCLYIQASHDNLVSSKNIKEFEKWFSNLDTCIVEGSHFLLQTNPKAVLGELLSHKVFEF